MDGRHIIEGTLGCPICRREFPVRDGIGWFTEASQSIPGRLTQAADAADDERVTRAAALLGLTDGGGIVCLDASWADCAEALAELGPAHIVLLNARPGDSSPEEVSALAV